MPPAAHRDFQIATERVCCACRNRHFLKQTLLQTNRFIGLILLLLFIAADSVTAFATSTEVESPILSSIWLAQVTDEKIIPPVIIPLETTPLSLLTHTADFTITAGEIAGTSTDLTLDFDATYRLENPERTPTTVILKIAETGSDRLPSSVTLTADGQPLNLFLTEGVGYTAQLQMNADSRVSVRMQYTKNFTALSLPLLAYTVDELTGWRGTPSLRVSIALPESISPDSWLNIAPAGWRYATANDATNALGGAGVKWLYDAQLPRAPFIFEFIHPYEWAQLQGLSQQAKEQPTQYQALGDRYRALLDATPLDADYQSVRERFYAQALAAYTAGIETLTPTGQSTGQFYAALAALYRARVAQPTGQVDTAYTDAMLDATAQALDQLPMLDERRRELTQWLADGLQLRLTNAEQREAWPLALQTIEALSALPSDIVDNDRLEQTRRTIVVRQALQLLEDDNRSAAIAIAGTEVADATLLPPPQQVTLFRRWEISVTVSAEEIAVTVVPFSFANRQTEADRAFTELVQLLETADAGAISVDWQAATSETENAVASGEKLGNLSIVAASDTSFAPLTTRIAPIPQWALLNTLLRQLQPTVETEAQWLNQHTSVQLPLDLHLAGDEWFLAASTLETTATAMEAEAASRDTRDAAAAEAALNLRMQAANYQASAAEWERLIRDSWVAVELTVASGLQESTQTKLLTATSPATLLSIASAPSYTFSFIVVTVLGMLGLLVLSGLLWWLL